MAYTLSGYDIRVLKEAIDKEANTLAYLATQPPVYDTGGTIIKRATEARLSGSSIEIDNELKFNARGVKDFSILANLSFSGLAVNDGVELIFSGSSSAVTFDGFVEVISGSTFIISGVSTVSFSSYTPYNIVNISGIFHNPNKTVDPNIAGLGGIYWRNANGLSSDIDLLAGSNLNWFVIY